MKFSMLLCLSLVCAAASVTPAWAQEEAKQAQTITLGDGALEMTVPEGWKAVRPRVGIIEHEMSIPAKEGDDSPGRLTIMGAGGSIEANIDRWRGQFSKLESDEVKKEKIAGQEVHFIEFSGDFRDQAGPFAPAVEKKGYTVLAAIIVTEKRGNYFLKFYGPKGTIEENKKKFEKMVQDMKAK